MSVQECVGHRTEGAKIVFYIGYTRSPLQIPKLTTSVVQAFIKEGFRWQTSRVEAANQVAARVENLVAVVAAAQVAEVVPAAAASPAAIKVAIKVAIKAVVLVAVVAVAQAAAIAEFFDRPGELNDSPAYSLLWRVRVDFTLPMEIHGIDFAEQSEVNAKVFGNAS